MVMYFRILYSLASLFILAGCAATPPVVKPVGFRDANYGTIPSNYEQIIKDKMAQRNVDPTSAIYRFGQPQRGFVTNASGSRFGWTVCGVMAVKSWSGAYGLSIPFYVLFENGEITELAPGMEYQESTNFMVATDDYTFNRKLVRRCGNAEDAPVIPEFGKALMNFNFMTMSWDEVK